MNRRDRVLAAQQRAAAEAIGTEAIFHQARVLLLVDTFSGRKRGLTMDRIACLDFVLRHPYLLPDIRETATPLAWPHDLAPEQFEKEAGEVKALRSRYGVWADRYMLVCGGLVARQLLVPSKENWSMLLTTREGRSAAKAMAMEAAWRVTAGRVRVLRTELDMAAPKLDWLIRHAIDAIEKD
ncbi:hypothetical protein [Spirillospora sp. CA-294931]|uniref:hypothetical protein n=1 Tax=Spirillospora sp. CA-294931 TaxID=3240042 RepID=UPI003D8C63A8